MNIKASTPLFLPIETTARELDAKLLLASAAIARGYNVIIGRKRKLRDHAIKIGKGIFLLKDHTDREYELTIKPLQEVGVRVCSLDEEGLVWPSPQQYRSMRLGAGQAAKALDLLFLFGREQIAWVEPAIESRDSAKICVTGNPRFDLLREPYRNVFKQQVEVLKKQYKDYILINTKFSAGNYAPYYGEGYLERMKRIGKIRSVSDEQWHIEKKEYLSKLYGHYVRAVKSLSVEFPDTYFIVRPHPSENYDSWVKDLAALNNVLVENSGNVAPWIIGAAAVIHTNCTTGIEAYVGGTPVLRYHPEYDERFESKLPNSIGVGYNDIGGLCEALRKIIGEEGSTKFSHTLGVEELLNLHLANATGTVSHKAILDALERVRDMSGTCVLDHLVIDIPIKARVGTAFVEFARRIEYPLLAIVGAGWYRKLARREQKFYGISESDLEEKVRFFLSEVDEVKRTCLTVKKLGLDNYLLALEK